MEKSKDKLIESFFFFKMEDEIGCRSYGVRRICFGV